MNIPTPAEYRAAFLALRPFPDKHLDLLRIHYQAPEYTATATQLATAVGYKKHNALNLQYRKMAERFCEHFSVQPDSTLSILMTFPTPKDAGSEHGQLTLRPEVVEALIGLSWFRKAPVAAVTQEA